jgi:predicted sugar kinase
MSENHNDTLLTVDDFKPFTVGTVANLYRGPLRPPKAETKFSVATYPSRLNLMAVDPSRIAVACGRIYEAGEICLAIENPLRVSIQRSAETSIRGTSRTEIVRHVLKIFNAAIHSKANYFVEVEGRDLPHFGLGSSSRLSACVARALNCFWGMPLDPWYLVRYLAANHGEETGDSTNLLVPVQCIGGGGIAGLVDHPFYILSGDATLIGQYPVDEKYRVVLAYPEQSNPRDAAAMMAEEAKDLYRFYTIGQTHGRDIAYRVFHQLLPAAVKGNWRTVGEVLDWYRYDLGSVKACSFSHERFLDLAGLVRQLRIDGLADMAGPSSVGPACYLLTKQPSECIEAMEAAGFKSETFCLISPGRSFCK